jgi:serine/threonine protein kinase
MTIDPTFDPLKERLQRAVAPDYRVEHRIGEGGMGVVYRAHEVLMTRAVAIKVLRPELATTDASETFLREAPMMGNVRHTRCARSIQRSLVICPTRLSRRFAWGFGVSPSRRNRC